MSPRPTIIIACELASQPLSRPPHKPYICADCEKGFATSGHLGRHQRVHTGSLDYACEFPNCTTRCSRRDNLRAHYRLHFDVRDPEELRRIAPEKRRRKPRVVRVACVQDVPTWVQYAPPPSGNHSPGENSDTTQHSPSASSSSNSSSDSSFSLSPYEQYPQESFGASPPEPVEHEPLFPCPPMSHLQRVPLFSNLNEEPWQGRPCLPPQTQYVSRLVDDVLCHAPPFSRASYIP